MIERILHIFLLFTRDFLCSAICVRPYLLPNHLTPEVKCFLIMNRFQLSQYYLTRGTRYLSLKSIFPLVSILVNLSGDLVAI